MCYYANSFLFFLVKSRKPLLYTCPNINCHKSYKSKGSLSSHFNYQCGKPPMYKCPYCTKKFSLKGNMKKHIILIHKQVLVPDLSEQFSIKTSYFK